MHMTDIRAEVLYYLLRGLFSRKMRGRKLPKRSEIIARETVQKLTEFRGIGKDTDRRHQKRNPLFFRFRQDLGHKGRNGGKYLAFLSLPVSDSEPDVRDMKLYGDLDTA